MKHFSGEIPFELLPVGQDSKQVVGLLVMDPLMIICFNENKSLGKRLHFRFLISKSLTGHQAMCDL